MCWVQTLSTNARQKVDSFHPSSAKQGPGPSPQTTPGLLSVLPLIVAGLDGQHRAHSPLCLSEPGQSLPQPYSAPKAPHSLRLQPLLM